MNKEEISVLQSHLSCRLSQTATHKDKEGKEGVEEISILLKNNNNSLVCAFT
jgi:hypothetical protein